MSRKNFIPGLMIAATAFLASCGIQAHVQKVPGVALDSYKTYSWITESKDSSNAKSYANFEEAFLKKSIAEQLAKKGYREVQGKSDISVDYDVLIENGEYEKREAVYSQPFIDYRYNPYTRQMYRVYYPSRYIGDNSYTVPYKSGTLTVNIVDNKTNAVAWQGWAETDIDRKKLSTNEIQHTVDAIFKKFK